MWCIKTVDNNKTVLYVKITPNAKKNQFLGIIESVQPNLLKIAIKSPPIGGAANKELILFLSKIFNISKSNILIIKGLTSCKKIVIINGISQENIINIITTLLGKKHELSNQLLLI